MDSLNLSLNGGHDRLTFVLKTYLITFLLSYMRPCSNAHGLVFDNTTFIRGQQTSRWQIITPHVRA